jgi:hypothetical protein
MIWPYLLLPYQAHMNNRLCPFPGTFTPRVLTRWCTHARLQTVLVKRRSKSSISEWLFLCQLALHKLDFWEHYSQNNSGDVVLPSYIWTAFHPATTSEVASRLMQLVNIDDRNIIFPFARMGCMARSIKLISISINFIAVVTYPNCRTSNTQMLRE